MRSDPDTHVVVAGVVTGRRKEETRSVETASEILPRRCGGAD